MTTRYFTYIADNIASAKARADVLASQIGHHAIEGEIREVAIRSCVEPFLTQSYVCGTGKIIDSFGSLSDQIDLVVFHRKVAPPILVNRDLGFFPVECVRYVFEVKSRLTAEEIRDANRKFASVNKLISFPKPQPDGTVKSGSLPAAVLFAFGSDIQGSEIDRYIKHTDDGHPPCIVLCVLGKGYWWYDAKSRSWYGKDTSMIGPPPYTEFCMFITGLMNTLAAEETSMIPFQPGVYVGFDDFILEERHIGASGKAGTAAGNTQEARQ
jgi:hypothetical protein